MCKPHSTSFEAMRQSAQRAGLVVSHLINPGCAVVPSATERDTLYILTRVDGAWVCNCPSPGRCWHQDRAAQLAAAAIPAPVLYCETQDAYLIPDDAPVAPSPKAARYAAAYADLFGAAA